jgi:hypothetical protein
MVMDFSSQYIMGVGNYTVAIDVPCSTSGEWRYDLLQIGADVEIDYITGECGVDPAFPAVSEDHLQIGDYVFVAWQTTVIEGWNIGHTQTVQVPTWLDIEIAAIAPAEFDSTYSLFEWCDPGGCAAYPNPEVYIKVLVQDQTGLDCFPGAGGFDFTLTKTAGTGQVWSADDGYSGASVTQNVTGDTKYWFKYKRIEDSTEYLPTFTIELDTVPPLSRGQMMLLKISGEQLAPQS